MLRVTPPVLYPTIPIHHRSPCSTYTVRSTELETESVACYPTSLPRLQMKLCLTKKHRLRDRKSLTPPVFSCGMNTFPAPTARGIWPVVLKLTSEKNMSSPFHKGTEKLCTYSSTKWTCSQNARHVLLSVSMRLVKTMGLNKQQWRRGDYYASSCLSA